VGLYIYASTLYPGGSQADLNSFGFDWKHNYWCNLMNEAGMNGIENPARPIAIGAMIILCISLTAFFFQFGKHYITDKSWGIVFKIASILSMTAAALMFTSYHDLMTILSSIFGAIVVIGIILKVYRRPLSFYKWLGGFNLLLLALNNIVYYTNYGIDHLPLLQKLTFIFVLIWIFGLSLTMVQDKNELKPG
jgi:hypothetical protein